MHDSIRQLASPVYDYAAGILTAGFLLLFHLHNIVGKDTSAFRTPTWSGPDHLDDIAADGPLDDDSFQPL